MTSKALAEFLTKHADCTRDGDRLQVPEGVRATLFAGVGVEPLVIEPITSVELTDDAAVVVTGRNERYVVLCEDVRALRFASAGQRAGVI